jgi:hypothetical protein
MNECASVMMASSRNTTFNTAQTLNNQFPLAIINIFKKRKTRKRFQLKKLKSVSSTVLTRILPYHKIDKGTKYNNSQHNK